MFTTEDSDTEPEIKMNVFFKLVAAGYRAIYQDYQDGSGNDKFEWDTTCHESILGLIIAF